MWRPTWSKARCVQEIQIEPLNDGTERNVLTFMLLPLKPLGKSFQRLLDKEGDWLEPRKDGDFMPVLSEVQLAIP